MYGSAGGISGKRKHEEEERIGRISIFLLSSI
jgi:hypothetical protein